MAWTKEQQRRTITDYWTGIATCSDCGGQLIKGSSAGASCTVSVTCRQCKQSFAWRQINDPLAAQFRPFTPDEIELIAIQYQSFRFARCPVDGARIDFSSTRPEGSRTQVIGTQVIGVCERCSAVAQKAVPIDGRTATRPRDSQEPST